MVPPTTKYANDRLDWPCMAVDDAGISLMVKSPLVALFVRRAHTYQRIFLARRPGCEVFESEGYI